jgi:death-on-curing protein
MNGKEIVYVSKEEALELHQDSIERFGGSHGLRDEGAFESALRATENRYHYEDSDLAACGATYAFHLCQAHAFVDGDKRIAAAASILFLRRNRLQITATIDELINLFSKSPPGK